MTVSSTLPMLIGALLLAHAGYSAHEHTVLLQTLSLSSSSPQSQATLPTSIPLDITIETLISVLLLAVGIVLSAEPLKPISWRVWAGQIEKEGKSLNHPYKGLEERSGFLDIRAKRKEFTDWVKERGSVKS